MDAQAGIRLTPPGKTQPTELSLHAGNSFGEGLSGDCCLHGIKLWIEG
jgi:hypothetical protein